MARLIVMSLLAAVFVVALTAAKDAFLTWWTTPLPTPPPQTDDILRAVLAACAAVGMNAEAIGPHTDLVVAGKLKDVLYMAGETLGKDVELRTVQDVVEWLAEAPPA